MTVATQVCFLASSTPVIQKKVQFLGPIATGAGFHDLGCGQLLALPRCMLVPPPGCWTVNQRAMQDWHISVIAVTSRLEPKMSW